MAHAVGTLPPGPATPAAWQLLRYSQSPLTFLDGCARRYGDPFTIRLAGYGKFVMMSLCRPLFVSSFFAESAS